MDAAELKKQLEIAVQLGKDVQTKNDKLEAKAEKMEGEQKTMLTKFEALSKQIEDGGGDVKQLETMAETIKELQDELSDLRLQKQKPSKLLPEETKTALKAIAGGAIGSFVAQKKRDGGVKSDDLGDFLTVAAECDC